MTAHSIRILRAIGVMAATCLPALTSLAQQPTARIVSAANHFLATLDQPQRTRVVFGFDDDAQRTRWSNLPVQMSPRAGLKMGALSATQRAAAMALVASTLSPKGFEKIQQIVEADEMLKVSERNNPMFGRDLYYISILGARHPRGSRGWCSSVDTISRSTSRSPAQPDC